MDDPFTAIYDRLWALVRDRMSTLVDKGNRIIFDGTASPLKSSVQHQDLPELILSPTGGTSASEVTSSQFEITPQYQWLLSTGSYDIRKKLFPLQWHLHLLMMYFRRTAGTVQFDGRSFIKDVRLLNQVTGDSNPEANRGIKGFSTLLVFECLCRFPRSLIDD